MKNGARSIVVCLLVGLALAGMWGCDQMGTGPTDTSASMQTSPTGTVTVVRLIAGRSLDVGTVAVWNDRENLYVKYTTTGDWWLAETHMAAEKSLQLIPMNKPGNPKVGLFSYHAIHNPPVHEHTYQINMAERGFQVGDVIYIAAQADVQQIQNGQVVRQETAWGEGEPFPGKNWAMYFTHTIGAPGWQLVYSTDFSTDPGWTTNNPSHFHWNPADGNYFIHWQNWTNEYAYKPVQWNGESFKVEWDMKLTHHQWAASLGLGMWDADMNIDQESVVYGHFGWDDAGHATVVLVRSLDVPEAKSGYWGSDAWEIDVWYHFMVEYDNAAGTVGYTSFRKSDSANLHTGTTANVGSFNSSMNRLGTSVVGFNRYSPGTYAEGYVDNVRYYVK